MLLANFDRKEHLQHRAVSLRQHGFLVLFIKCNSAQMDRFVYSALSNYTFTLAYTYVHASLAKPLQVIELN